MRSRPECREAQRSISGIRGKEHRREPNAILPESPPNFARLFKPYFEMSPRRFQAANFFAHGIGERVLARAETHHHGFGIFPEHSEPQLFEKLPSLQRKQNFREPQRRHRDGRDRPVCCVQSSTSMNIAVDTSVLSIAAGGVRRRILIRHHIFATGIIVCTCPLQSSKISALRSTR